MRLSCNQEQALRELHDRPDGTRYGWGSSCTNPTMSALQRRGLTEVEFDRSKGLPGSPWSRWLITDAGRQHVEEPRP